MHSVPTTTNASLNPTHDKVSSIQHHVIVCQRLVAGRWYSPVSFTNKTEMLLKVALNTINPPHHHYLHLDIKVKYLCFYCWFPFYSNSKVFKNGAYSWSSLNTDRCSCIRWFHAYIFYMSNAKSLEKLRWKLLLCED